MKIRYNTYTKKNINYITSKRKTKQLRDILKDEGFKRLFWSHPNSEVYSRGKIKAKIIYNGIEMSLYKHGDTRTKSKKNKIRLNKTLAKKIVSWYIDK